MASVSIDTLIIFIAALIISTGVAGTLYVGTSDIMGSVDERVEGLSKSIDTEIDIISDPGSTAIYNETETNVTLLVKNTGSNRLPAQKEKIDLLIDGQYVSAEQVEVISGNYWRKGEVARITISKDLNAGPHRAVVIINGDREVLEFHV